MTKTKTPDYLKHRAEALKADLQTSFSVSFKLDPETSRRNQEFFKKMFEAAKATRFEEAMSAQGLTDEHKAATRERAKCSSTYHYLMEALDSAVVPATSPMDFVHKKHMDILLDRIETIMRRSGDIEDVRMAILAFRVVNPGFTMSWSEK